MPPGDPLEMTLFARRLSASSILCEFLALEIVFGTAMIGRSVAGRFTPPAFGVREEPATGRGGLFSSDWPNSFS